MNAKTKKRLRKLERRLSRLEQVRDLPPVNTISTPRVDTDRMWRSAVSDYAQGWDDTEDWHNRHGYL